MAKNHLEKSKNPAKRNFKKIVKKQKFTHKQLTKLKEIQQ